MSTNNQTKSLEKKIDNDQVDISELIKILFDNLRNMMIFTLLFTLMAIIYIWNQPNVYRSQALVIPTDIQQNVGSSFSNQFGGIAALAGLSNNNNDTADTNIAILQSRVLIEGFIVDKNLMPQIFPEHWNNSKQDWNDNSPGINSAINEIQSAIQVKNQNQMKIISFDWTDPELATLWCNDLITYLNDHIRNKKIIEARKSISFLEDELKKTSLVNNKTILFNLLEEQTKNITLANVRDEYAFKFIDKAYLSTTSRIRPQRAQTAVFSLFAGFSLSILIVFTIALYRKYSSLFWPKQ